MSAPELVHWWLPGVAICGADDIIWQTFTGEPDMVTCPECRADVERKCAAIGVTPEQMGDDVRAVTTPP